MLEHGGGLLRAARETGIAPQQWLDLSTGINPNGWPVPAFPPDVWRRLPESGDGLMAAAAAYYGTEHLLAVSGSQAAIQLLPALRPAGRVGLVTPTYAEHGAAWRRAGHRLLELAPEAIDAAVDGLDVLLLVHPNNPTGQRYPLEQLRAWRERLARRGGWLVVDEAFMDATPLFSLAADCGDPGLVVLRSVGKFFGLAGIRLGFVAAWPALLQSMDECLGPWAVNGPARWAGALALADRDWQSPMRDELAAASRRLAALLTAAGLPPAGGTALFQWAPAPDAERRHAALKRQAVLARLFQEPSALRFGLPATEGEWARLERALATRP
ncbi:threonine-phosphate decarboxylase CobD [Methylogaea oryzae]|uniref:Threonine-phosphate decarboxylase n=1 Tax=Methylogaea oryzae TaxID=1295382 RepID=A0A8D4VMX2_9GAMM|nr:threonine-phosphate decarboxylase CobD [Methylogaea oryzae]BBL70521.1 threonine-phosphate decarboxylase [Methylogaea oryzae]